MTCAVSIDGNIVDLFDGIDDPLEAIEEFDRKHDRDDGALMVSLVFDSYDEVDGLVEWIEENRPELLTRGS